jgi:hypothetical protein
MSFARHWPIGVAFFMCSCSPLASIDDPLIVNSIQEAATVHIAPLSVSRWEDYRASLQPQFPISAANALTLALPRTSISQTKQSELLEAGLQIGNATGAGSLSSSSAPSSATSSASGATNTTSKTTTSNGSTTTQTNETALSLPTGTIAMDPLLTYEAATAIYQEIELLNTYVNDAVQRYGFVPYVARMQVSVVPTAHLEPYDVYVDLGFFSRCLDHRDSTPVVVVPLLVTDDVETGQASSAVENARQLAASLGGITGNVAVQAGLAQLKGAFNAILGTDYNSLYMATHAADNVLEIRLGAARSPNPKVKYAMLTQTHDVSLLMLVNKKNVDGLPSCYLQPPLARESLTADEELYAADAFKDDFRRFLANLNLSSDDSAQFSEAGYKAIDDAANAPRESAIEAAQRATIKQAEAVQAILEKKGWPEDKISAAAENLKSAVHELLNPDVVADRLANSGPQVWVSGYKRMRNAVTGVELPSDSTVELDRASTVLKPFVSSEEARKSSYSADVAMLVDSVQRNDSTVFDSLFCRMRTESSASSRSCTDVNDLPGGKADAVWTGLASVISMRQYSSTYFNLPKRRQPDFTFFQYQDATVLLQDSCKNSASIVLAGLAPWTANDFSAKLILDPPPGTTAGGNNTFKGIELVAISIAQATPNGPFTIQFPSLKPYAEIEDIADHATIAAMCPPELHRQKAKSPAVAKDTTSATRLKAATLFIQQSSDDRWNGNNRPAELTSLELKNVFYSSSPAELETSLGITAASDTITAVPNTASASEGGTAQLRLQLKAGKDLQDVVLSFSGATLATLPSLPYTKPAEDKLPNGSSLPLAAIAVTPPDNLAFGSTPVSLDVSLKGITVARVVTITATGRDKQKKAVTVSSLALPVVAPAASSNPNASTNPK